MQEVTGTVNVTATDLDIRDLNSAQDSVSAVQSGDWNVSLLDVYLALKTIINLLERPIWTYPVTGALRTILQTSAGVVDTLSAVTTVTDVTRLNNFGATSGTAQNALYTLVFSTEKINWALNIRAKIT